MLRFVSLVSVLASLSLPAAAGAALENVDLSPLLRVNATLTTRVPLVDPFTNLIEDRDLFVSRGGALASTRINKGFNTIETTLVRGVAEPAELSELLQALAASRVGFQEDCQIVSPGLEDGGPLGTVDVTWYGRGARRNVFTVTYAVEGTSALPICPAVIDQLLAALATFETEVFSNPMTEVLRSE